MSRSLSLVLVVGILLIAALTGYGLVTAVQGVTRPMAASENTVATQMAGILPASPTPLPNGQAVVLSIRSLNRLEAAEFVIEKVIIKEANQGALGALFGDRVIFVAHGTVIGGVDLSKMQVSDVQVLPSGKAYVVMPAAEVLVTAIDNKRSYVVDRQTGLLTKGDVNLETEARREAENEISQAAQEAGILEQAQKNAEINIRQLLLALGYNDVTFVRATPAPKP
jgi:hypothetical protein